MRDEYDDYLRWATKVVFYAGLVVGVFLGFVAGMVVGLLVL